MIEETMPPLRTKRVLGISFFDGTTEEAVAYICARGGLVVAPAAPSIIALQNDAAYREAISDADLAIADSGWMVLFWRVLRGEKLPRISGLRFFKSLLQLQEIREAGNLLWILPSENAKAKALAWSASENFPLRPDDLYVAPYYGGRAQDSALLEILRQKKPKHIVIAIGGGMQDKLGSYLKRNCGYCPAIHCIGAAPGFVIGDQVRIPMWADRFRVGWILRILFHPREYLPRYWGARGLAALIRKYGTEMPPLRAGAPRY
jgi:N-acetylglucosaminyldiphosphoundecaprenol N-acetyl-beta-D-mannosaminyltransferase